MKLSLFFIGANLSVICASVFAQQHDIGAFINSTTTPTYDCPAENIAEQTERYIALDTLSDEQRYALTSMQTHGQICNGNNASAEETLLTLIQSPNIDKSTRHLPLPSINSDSYMTFSLTPSVVTFTNKLRLWLKIPIWMCI